jgi:hypothetical protein
MNYHFNGGVHAMKKVCKCGNCEIGKVLRWHEDEIIRLGESVKILNKYYDRDGPGPLSKIIKKNLRARIKQHKSYIAAIKNLESKHVETL